MRIPSLILSYPLFRIMYCHTCSDAISVLHEQITEDSTKGSKATLVYGQMNEPPGARARVALTGLTIAEVKSRTYIRGVRELEDDVSIVLCLRKML